MNETNIEKTEDNTCSTPDAEADDENGAMECGDYGISTYDEAKDYLLKHRSIALPVRFLRIRTHRCHRIESLAARFTYRPSVPWSHPLDDWRRELLTKCFGLQIIQLPYGSLRAGERRKPIPDPVLHYVEILEELWQFEFETANELIHATWLYNQSLKLLLPESFNFVSEELKRKKKSLTQRLCAIVAHEWLLMECIVLPQETLNVSFRELVGDRYRQYNEVWWVDFMKQLCNLRKVPRWILKERMADALLIPTNRYRLGFSGRVLDEFSVGDRSGDQVEASDRSAEP